MSLPAGTRLGPFEIQTPLGAGGMGEVYLARDTRLDRTVAIKVLPQHVRSDPALRERFEREARAISALSHPHICTLYDIGQDGDVDFLVMEHLSGETLAQRLVRGPLGWPQALDLAVQMARALDAAHRRRIVHRDLKPGNVMLVKGGPGRAGASQAKLLDFGLARLVPPAALDTPLATALTMTTPIGETQPLTAQGSILGTLQYMAPEQLEGRDADARSDIFALGATLYEMLAGRRPFEAKSHAGLVAAIMEHDPPPIASVAPAAGVPPAVDRIVAKCLAKDPDARWQSAGDLADALGWVMEGTGATAPGENQGGTGSRWRGAGGWIAAAVLLAVLAFVVLTTWSRPAAEPASVRRLAIEPRAGQSFVGGGLAFSPDGNRLVYAAATGGKSQLYVRALDRLEGSPIPGTEDGRAPFFSPDGEWIGFFTSVGMKKVSLRGGQPVMVTRLPPVARGGTWLPDDTIVFSASQSAGLTRVPAAGGASTAVTDPGTGSEDGAHLWPQALPGGRDILLTVRPEATPDVNIGRIVIHSLETGERHLLVANGAFARYLPSGHLAFVRDGTLMVAPVDLERRRLSGTPVPLVEDVLISELGGPQFDAAGDGTLAYLEGRPVQTIGTLLMVDRNGSERAILQAPGWMGSPRLSPDGQRVLLTVATTGIPDIWIGDIGRRTLTRLTHDPRDEFNAIWWPDGNGGRILYSLFPIGYAPKLVWRTPDGAGAAERLVETERHDAQFAGSVSHDGRWLAYSQALARASSDIWIMPLEGDRRPRALVSTPFDDYGPEFSPDGHWLAYTSNESGRYEVYVMPFPGPGAKRQISRAGGVGPAWAPGGTELYYVSGTTLHTVTIGPDFGEPRALFEAPSLSMSTEDHPRAFDVHPDGKHFLMVREEEPKGAVPPRLNVVLGWTTDLLRR